MLEYAVRIRDARTAKERWLTGADGELLVLRDRMTADFMALAVTDHAVSQLGYVVENDTQWSALS